MNNTLSTTLQILALLWLVQDVYAGESKRRPGKADFFFDDALEKSTPRANPTDSSPLQSILQSAFPKEEKPAKDSDKSGDDGKPENNLSFLGNIGSLGGIGSLADMWKLVQHLTSVLNPLVGKSAEKGPPKEKLSPKVNITGTTSPYGHIRLDEPFQTAVEYASGNDSHDDEDYENSMNFSSPNPQIHLANQTPSDSSYLTPKSVNQDTSEPYGNGTTVTSNPSTTSEDSRDYDVSKSPDIVDEKEGITISDTSEFIDDYINGPSPGKGVDKDANVTTQALKNYEMDPETSTLSLSDDSVTVGNNDTSTDSINTDYTASTISPENENVTNIPSIHSENKVDLTTEDINYSTQAPDKGTTEISGNGTKGTTKDNTQQNASMKTESPDDENGKPYDNISTLETTPLLSSTSTPPSKSLKRPKLTKTPSPRNKKNPKEPTDEPKIKKKADLGNTSSTPSPLEENDNVKNNTKEMQRPQKNNSTNQIIYDKPTLLVSNIIIINNNSLNTNLKPEEITQPSNKTEIPVAQNESLKKQPNGSKPLTPYAKTNKTEETSKNLPSNMKSLTPQNQLNKTEPSGNQPNDTKPLTPKNQLNNTKPLMPQNQPNTIDPSKNQPNNAKPLTLQNQVNKKGKPSETQPNNTELQTPQNQTNAEKSPSENNTEQTPVLTPHDQKHFAAFLDQFPSIKAILPKISNLPLLQMVLGNTENQSNTTVLPNCRDMCLRTTIGDRTQGNFSVKVTPTLDGVTTSPSIPENFTSPTSKQQSGSVTSPTSKQQSITTTTYPPEEATPQVDSDDLQPDASDNEEYTPDETNENTEEDTDDNTYDTEDNTDDPEGNADYAENPEDNTNESADDDTNKNTEDDNKNNEEIDDLSNFDNSQEVPVTPTSTTSQAGTGKRNVVKKVVQLIPDRICPESATVLVPSGVSAINIGGRTLHSALRSPTNLNRFSTLRGSSARLFRKLIDEFSMIGCNMMNAVEKRCKRAKPSSQEPFGGLFVYLIGDVRQFPPVHAKPLFTQSDYLGERDLQALTAMNSFGKCFKLIIPLTQVVESQITSQTAGERVLWTNNQ